MIRRRFAGREPELAKMMAWFWDADEPDVERRLEPLASPLRAGDEQLAGPPPASGSSARPTCCTTRARPDDHLHPPGPSDRRL